jgi:hypothetical protein
VYPAQLAVVLPEDAIATVEGVTLFQDMLGQVARHALSVIRVHEGEPARDAPLERWKNAEHFVETRRARPVPGGHVKTIGPQLADDLRSLEEPLRFPRCCRLSPPFGDVGQNRRE